MQYLFTLIAVLLKFFFTPVIIRALNMPRVIYGSEGDNNHKNASSKLFLNAALFFLENTPNKKERDRLPRLGRGFARPVRAALRRTLGHAAMDGGHRARAPDGRVGRRAEKGHRS